VRTSEQGFSSAYRVAGVDLGDAELAAAVQLGLDAVEDLLRAELSAGELFVSETALHLVQAGGKRFRPLFTMLAAQLGPHPASAEVVRASAVVELIHLATLYHDDVMDEATMRRGAVSANARWDNSIAILTGDYLFAQASRLVAQLGPDAVRIIAETFAELVTGQMRETVGVKNGQDAVEHYLQVVAEKTGSLIATCGRYGAMFSGADAEQVQRLCRLGDAVGTAFQISDDIIDISSVAELAEALALLAVSPGLAKAKATLAGYAEAAHAELAALPGGAANTALQRLVDYTVSRTG